MAPSRSMSRAGATSTGTAPFHRVEPHHIIRPPLPWQPASSSPTPSPASCWREASAFPSDRWRLCVAFSLTPSDCLGCRAAHAPPKTIVIFCDLELLLSLIAAMSYGLSLAAFF